MYMNNMSRPTYRRLHVSCHVAAMSASPLTALIAIPTSSQWTHHGDNTKSVQRTEQGNVGEYLHLACSTRARGANRPAWRSSRSRTTMALCLVHTSFFPEGRVGLWSRSFVFRPETRRQQLLLNQQRLLCRLPSAVCRWVVRR